MVAPARHQPRFEDIRGPSLACSTLTLEIGGGKVTFFDPPITEAKRIYDRVLDGFSEDLRHDVATALFVSAVLKQGEVRALISAGDGYAAACLSAGGYQLNLWRHAAERTKASLYTPLDTGTARPLGFQLDVERLALTPIQTLAAESLPISDSAEENELRAAALLTAAYHAVREAAPPLRKP